MPEQLYLKIKGQQASEEMMQNLLEVKVESNSHLPAMFSLTLQDSEFTWIDSTIIDVGNEVEIEIETDEIIDEPSPTRDQLFKGEITAIEPEFGKSGNPLLSVRGYDKGHRLHRGRHQRAFQDLKDSDLANQLAGEADLSPDVTATNVTHGHLYQNNLTNWEFLKERAQRVGYDCYVDDGKLVFKEPAQGTAVELIWGQNLVSFYPSLSSAGQVSEVEVRGWDPQGKTAIVGTKKTATDLTPEIGVSGSGWDAAKGFGDAKLTIVDQPVYSADEATKLAESVAAELSGDFVRAEGTAFGHPRIMAGKTVEIKGVGQRFSGKYYVTRAVHKYHKGMYETQFSVTGRNPLSVTALVHKANGRSAGRIYGLVVGVVTMNEDPDEKGRVKVKFPWMADDVESNWARVAAPMAGPDRGFFCIPEVDDEVVVGFEHGDVNFPYVVGSLWNGSDAMPIAPGTAMNGSEVNQRIFRTRIGHRLVFDDVGGKGEITLVDSSDTYQMKLDAANENLVVSAGEHVITLDKAGNQISIKSPGKIIIESTEDTEINCMNFKVTAKSGLEMKANAQLKLEGSAGAQLSSPAQTVIKGGVVQIN